MKKLKTRFYENNKNRENVLRLSENNAFCLECVGQQVAMCRNKKQLYRRPFFISERAGRESGMERSDGVSMIST